MMKWYYTWRLARANERLSRAMAALPDNWADRPENNTEEIIEWALAHGRVVHWLEKLS
jgi:hypothetical protein